ncbi:mitochondrial dna helicase [Phaffia rhodozyma]|uniref:ATP-dependent DNA helicase PIF1 n=1 Tax=Phaffia rhodozyma TaxID=264483 RepID=A0A0F7ST27_PHARH|nr:mitochondrial dna helicase [Phaffia rhodozyma]
MSRINSFKRSWAGEDTPQTADVAKDRIRPSMYRPTGPTLAASSISSTPPHRTKPSSSIEIIELDDDDGDSSRQSAPPKQANSSFTRPAPATDTTAPAPPAYSPRTRRRIAIMGEAAALSPSFNSTFNLPTKRPAYESLIDGSTGQTRKRIVSENSVVKAVVKPVKKKAIVLSNEQKAVLDIVVNQGQNVFFTGSAGTGKSVLLREIIKGLRTKYATRPDAVAVTAATGIAACNVGGTTLHSFSGIGLGNEPADRLVSKIRKSKPASGRWNRTKVLIIDEVSMVDGDLFDKLSKIGTMLRRDQRPFGGIQIIMTGDFFQLPPVSRDSSAKFAFESAMWKETIHRTVNLTEVFRQKDQRKYFVRVRTPEFQALSREVVYADGIEPTELYPRREDVEAANANRLRSLHQDTIRFTAEDYAGQTGMDRAQLKKELSNMLAVEELNLKIGAQVMLIKNIDDDLVNGSVGKVVGFHTEAEWGMVSREYELDGLSGFSSSGSSSVDPNTGEEKVWSAGGKPMKEQTLRQQEAAQQSTRKFPAIRFALASGGYRNRLIIAESFKIDMPDGTLKAERKQVPLILAWAMSIHKSQGQTLERVKVDLRRVFEKGQAYVALSRATSIDALQVLSFDSKKASHSLVMCHPKVAKFHTSLETI